MPDSMIDILDRALQNAGCHVRTMHFSKADDSGILRVTTGDDRIYSVHFDLSENQNPG